MPADPRISKALEALKREMPNLNTSGMPSPMGPLGKMVSGGAEAVTAPWGSVYYNPEALATKTQPQMEDTLYHELTHKRQLDEMPWREKLMAPITGLMKSFGGGLPYGQDPNELEAWQAEKDRRLQQQRPQDPTPYFTKPDMNPADDINLFPVRKPLNGNYPR